MSTSRRERWERIAAVAVVLAGAVMAAGVAWEAAEEDDTPAATSSAPSVDAPSSHSPSSHSPSGHEPSGTETPAEQPLRAGERVLELAMPEPYRPQAQSPGTDDYRCFLLDPGLTQSAFVTGVDVRPGQRDMVHHVILFHVPPDQVQAAARRDATEPGQGWTCFGGTGLGTTAGAGLDGAPWLGAWAPGGGERLLADDVGIPVAAGSQVIMQVHYNLLAGDAEDVSSARLRLAPGTAPLAALETVLLPAPVELPCRPEHADGDLCDRDAALGDVMSRFGEQAGVMAAGLQVLCGGSWTSPVASDVQSCDRPVREPATVRAAAGHMHLLGREIRIELNPGTPSAKTLLDVPVWDFDDQGARALPEPVSMQPGDVLRVTCRHDQSLRDHLPAFEGRPDRYVLWGEGTTDEMCLGIVMVTRP